MIIGLFRSKKAASLFQAAFSKLAPNLSKVYSTWHSYLSSLSLHRKREYEQACSEEGLEPHAIPAMCDTRFRMNIRFALWMEKDDRCLYFCATKLRDKIKMGLHKDVTEAETTILKDFLGNYLVVRLTNMFFIDVSDPVITLLNHFESEEPLIHKRWDMLANFFYKFLSKFMKNAGGENEPISELLKTDFKDSKLQLSDGNIFLGGKVETFLKDLGLSRQSSEIKPWLENVRAFYVEALERCVKYMKPSLTSSTLHKLEIINPKSIFAFSLDDLKKKYAYVAKKFPNVIKPSQIPELLDQVSLLKFQKRMQETTSELRPTEFYVQLSKVPDQKFSLVSKLCLALLTTHNSGSSAERDISDMNSLLADPRTNRTQQLRLQARLKVRSHVNNLRFKCLTCNAVRMKKLLQQSPSDDDSGSESEEFETKGDNRLGDEEEEGIDARRFVEEAEEIEPEEDITEDSNGSRKGHIKGEKSSHCHCDLFNLDDDLKVYMSDGQPYRRFKADVLEKRKTKLENLRIRQHMKKSDDNRIKQDMKVELSRLRRKLKEDLKEKMNTAKAKPLTEVEKKEQRSKRKQEIQDQREAKRKQLFLALEI